MNTLNHILHNPHAGHINDVVTRIHDLLVAWHDLLILLYAFLSHLWA
jgi:hypothetical protein